VTTNLHALRDVVRSFRRCRLKAMVCKLNKQESPAEGAGAPAIGNRMQKILAAAAMTMLGLGCPTAHAQDAPSPPQTAPAAVTTGPVLAFSVTAASDYIFRGISQTENAAAVFGAGSVSYDNFYAGVGMENVNFHNGIKAEYDLSAGWTPAVDGFKFDLGVIRYGYTDQPAHVQIDTVELKGALAHDFGPATLGAAIYYSDNYFGSHRDDIYVEGRAAYKITSQLTVSGAVGRQSDGLADHTTWNAGAAYAFAPHVALDLRYSDTDQHDLGHIYGSHFTAAITASY
jgi:uncharacterized protein (TIGR02001 family)